MGVMQRERCTTQQQCAASRHITREPTISPEDVESSQATGEMVGSRVICRDAAHCCCVVQRSLCITPIGQKRSVGGFYGLPVAIFPLGCNLLHPFGWHPQDNISLAHSFLGGLTPDDHFSGLLVMIHSEVVSEEPNDFGMVLESTLRPGDVQLQSVIEQGFNLAHDCFRLTLRTENSQHEII